MIFNRVIFGLLISLVKRLHNMHITKIHIENFKSLRNFDLNLKNGINILVGDNEAGKSTIIEALHLCLTGYLGGKYFRNELTQYIFNIDAVSEYIKNLKGDKDTVPIPPEILIEVYVDGEDSILYEGTWSSSGKTPQKGFYLKIAFNERYKKEYQELVALEGIKTLPIEYYDIQWSTFALDETITPKFLPIKSALIDSSNHRLQTGSDVYISRIIKEFLESHEVVEVSQAHRKMKETFMGEESIKKINEKIKTAANISEKKVELSIELSSKNAWESSLITYLDDIPFHFIGKGEQCLVKTKLALSHKKAIAANIILLEEPENHLSHAKLNQLIDYLNTNTNKQMVISTHNSFVANKLGLENLIFLNDRKTLTLQELHPDTQSFFKKLAGYDTLRLILCQKAILVEGDSDELVVQKAYLNKYGKLPIHDGIDIISVGTSFLRFLEIAVKLNKPTIVVTDNDGNLEALEKKYKDYQTDEFKSLIKICYDKTTDEGKLSISNIPFNYNTLEPKLLKENSINLFNKIFGTNHVDHNTMHVYMKANKTECALKIFESSENIIFPKYILDAIDE